MVVEVRACIWVDRSMRVCERLKNGCFFHGRRFEELNGVLAESLMVDLKRKCELLRKD